MNRSPQRFIAVDWSGDESRSGQKRKIWIADWNDGVLRLESGGDRRKTIDYLIRAAEDSASLVIGLDFAFSFPASFV